MSMLLQSLAQVRADFPIFQRQIRGKPLAYLDSAATSQKPLPVLEAMDRYYRAHNANIHRGVYLLAEEATLAYEEAHRAVARFLHARHPEEVVFTKNATEALNLAAASLTAGLRKGDEIVLTRMEHHSNLVPWLEHARLKGLAIRYLELTPEGKLQDFSAIGPRTKVVAATHVSNVLGTVNPIPALAAAAHAQGAILVVDGAQSVPHLPVDVQALGADLLAFSGHKMCGPTGSGGLWGRKDLLEQLPPCQYGGDMIREVTYQGATWNDLPWKFEAGTASIAEGIGLGAAVRYLQQVGMDAIHRHEQSLTRYAYQLLQEEGATIYGPAPPRRAGVLSFNLPGIHPHDLATLLDQEGIAIRGGHHCAMPLMGLLGVPGTARASVYLYNTQEDIDRLAEGIRAAKKVFA